MKDLTKSMMLSAILCLAVADVRAISVEELQLERCLGKNGIFLPIPGSCTQFLVCVEGIGIISTCGQNHFDARRGVCDLPSKAGCIATLPEFVDYLCLGLMDDTKLPVPGNTSQYYLCSQGKPVIHTCESLQFDEATLQCKELDVPKPTVAPCFMVANGIRLPVAGSERQYYLCMNNKAFLKDCGSMYFDEKYSACVVKREKDSPKKVEEPAVIDESHDLVQRLCQNQRLGSRVARPDSCSEYYVCMGHTAIPKSCGVNQFNPITTLCDQPSVVRCSMKANGVTYGTQNTHLLPVAETSPTGVNVCNGQRDGIFIAAPGKCSDFYFCFKNKSYHKTCGEDFHFSPITMSCVTLEESNCVDARPEASSVENACLGKANGILLRHPLDCGKFMVCDNNKSVEMDCPAGLHFNLEQSFCDWPENAKCL